MATITNVFLLAHIHRTTTYPQIRQQQLGSLFPIVKIYV